MNISNGKITKINAIKLELKVSKNSTSGNTETKTKKCKIAPSNTLSKVLEYGLEIWWIKSIVTQAVMSKYRKTKSLDELAMIIIIITSRQIM